jgi:mannose-1-phosphate guanylyltransferase/mannose-6-phosphate isomerase
VVEGSIDVTIGNKTMTVSENQSVYIPKETVHRLTNTTQKPVSLIEVQSGSYLGEDDIVRLEDVYNRGEKYDGI